MPPLLRRQGGKARMAADETAFIPESDDVAEIKDAAMKVLKLTL
jgi:hypothetical protein